MNRRVLIVDNDADLAGQLKSLLEQHYDTAAASNGFEALKRLDEHPADIVLVDLRMPGLNGPGFVDELRRRGHAARIILISAYPDLSKHARRLGVAGYLAKPFAIEQLKVLIEKALQGGGNGEALGGG